MILYNSISQNNELKGLNKAIAESSNLKVRYSLDHLKSLSKYQNSIGSLLGNIILKKKEK